LNEKKVRIVDLCRRLTIVSDEAVRVWAKEGPSFSGTRDSLKFSFKKTCEELWVELTEFLESEVRCSLPELQEPMRKLIEYFEVTEIEDDDE